MRIVDFVKRRGGFRVRIVDFVKRRGGFRVRIVDFEERRGGFSCRMRLSKLRFILIVRRAYCVSATESVPKT